MSSTSSGQVNNEVYHHLGERWYSAKDDPIALLRAESRARNPWIIAELQKAFPHSSPKILDMGCGGGFLANNLAQAGFAVTGLDASEESLNIAKNYDATGQVNYQQGDANQLPFAANSFAAVCAMDFLEHVENPANIVAEAARVLQPNGLFFFHTFNRNLFSWLIGIKGVEIFVKNTPPNLHLYRHFIKPRELQKFCEQSGLQVKEMRGLAPDLFRPAFWQMLITGFVDDSFAFKFTGSQIMGYCGVAVKSS